MFKLSADQIRQRVRIGVDRDDLEDLYMDYINMAIREIENRSSFAYMKKSNPVTLVAGDTTTSMPDDFKELVRLQTPISRITDNNNGLPSVTPCAVYSRQRLESLNSSFGALIATTSGREQKISIMVDCTDSQWFIGLLSPTTEDVVFRVNYYGYSDRVTDTDEQHPLFTYYPSLIITGAKYLIFDDINDPQKDKAEASFERQLLKAKGTDKTVAFSGFDSHM